MTWQIWPTSKPACGMAGTVEEQFMDRSIFLFILSLALCGALSCCIPADLRTASEIDNAIEEYHAKAPEVKLGDHKNKALSILHPTQAAIPARFRKPRDTFTDTSVRNGRIEAESSE
jgi:hypothetical protein